MIVDTGQRASDCALVDTVWSSQSVGGGSFISPAAGNLELVITRQQQAITFTVRGPESKATPAPIPADAEFFGILFKLGTFIPCLSPAELVDGGVHLPLTTSQTFWLHGSAWELPNFDNADAFADRLVRAGLLAYEPIVEAALQGQIPDISLRSVQRRFLRATGLTHKTLHQIERARYAATLLQQGVSILDTVEEAGYYDQPHMTRALRLLIGNTPAEIVRSNPAE